MKSSYVTSDVNFKGPLITKDGMLYNDEDYDQTYKRRLRLREVESIRDYLKQIEEDMGHVIHEVEEIDFEGLASH